MTTVDLEIRKGRGSNAGLYAPKVAPGAIIIFSSKFNDDQHVEVTFSDAWPFAAAPNSEQSFKIPADGPRPLRIAKDGGTYPFSISSQPTAEDLLLTVGDPGLDLLGITVCPQQLRTQIWVPAQEQIQLAVTKAAEVGSVMLLVSDESPSTMKEFPINQAHWKSETIPVDGRLTVMLSNALNSTEAETTSGSTFESGGTEVVDIFVDP